MRRNRQIDVSRALVLAGAFSFLLSAAKACLLPFLTLYLRHLGLKPTETGLVMGTKHLLTLVWSPLVGLLSKRYDKRRTLIVGCLVLSSTIAMLFPVIPPADVHNTGCNDSISQLSPTQSTLDREQTQASSTSHAKYKVDPSDPPIEARNSSGVESGKANSNVDLTNSRKQTDIRQQLFFLTLITVSFLSTALAPLEWTADDGLFEYLDFADASDRYSASKTWSLIGAAFGVGGAGVIVSRLNCLLITETPRGAAHFVCFSIIALVTLPVASFLPFYLNRKRSRPNGLVKGLQLVRGSIRGLLCGITIILVGAVSSSVENFLLWEMQDNGSTELHMGLSLAFGLISQASLPLFVVKISKKLTPGRVLVLAAAIVAVQCFYFSFLWGPWAVLPAQMLNAVSFGALWWAVQVQCDDIATPGTEKSVARVYNVLCLDVGRALGSVIAGLAVQRFGIAWMFRGAALGLIVWCCALALLQVKAPRQRRINYSRLLAADASENSESDSEPEKDWLDKAMVDDWSNNNSGRRMHH